MQIALDHSTPWAATEIVPGLPTVIYSVPLARPMLVLDSPNEEAVTFILRKVNDAVLCISGHHSDPAISMPTALCSRESEVS